MMDDNTDTATLDRGDDFDPAAAETAAALEAGKGAPTEAATAAALEAELAQKAAIEVAETAEKTDSKTEATAALEEEADKTKNKDTRIPLVRHNAVLGKVRETVEELRRENAALKARKDNFALAENITATDEAIQAMETAYATLLTDGEIAKATAKMAEIRKAERDMAEAKSDVKIQAAVAHATESARYATALGRIEAQYPVLNEDDEAFDPAVMAEVIEMKNGYQAQGYTPTEAMQKAVRKELGATTAAQTKVLTVTPQVSATEAAEAAATALATARKTAATKKTVTAVEGQPASTAKVGLDSDKLGGALDAKAVMKMSQTEFSKLPEEMLSRMRGDTL